jgi:predicted PurR-regulated permease PerM
MTQFRNTDPLSSVLTWVGLAVLLWLVYLVFRPFLIPLAWACVLASVSYPVYERLGRRGWKPAAAATLTTAAVTLVVIVPGVLVATAFVRQTVEIGAEFKEAFSGGQLDWVNRAWSALQGRFPPAADIDLETLGTEGLKQSGAFLMAASGLIFQNVATFVLDLALALFATFFLLRDADAIMRTVRRLLPMEEVAREQLIERTRDLIAAGVFSSVVVAVLQGFLGGVALALVGIRAPVFWGVVTAFACLLPFGAWVVWLPAAVILAASGAIVRAVVLVVLGLALVSSVDNIVRPMLLSGRAHINGLVIFVSLLGGLAAFGLLGLVLGPVLVVTALSLLDGYLKQAA